ncbi:hypothetical protein FRACYDRAFT_251068 [Fragilariopsis cylindrus CCMP1102]|uniref:Uncharacterized protein n=1 Tax=Fragilariopsis cylindrus CCMP1102 TaxID=635003 RepID=A0A1E7EMW6_9STRA|nr:hypothetical protein FRACYDRAFT_251068 [Fragilariopsis cylindrus CCMP1102]|eukprot:OEU07289.1 hypothetical protein FRACYDRAFT_251068 [Fragilariopsis cylindrus CCMP1102]
MSVMSVALVTMFLTVAASVTAFVVHQSDTTILNALNVRSRTRIKQQQQVVEQTTKWTKNNLNNSFSSSTSTTLLSSSVDNNRNENESNKTEDNEVLISSLQNTLCSIEALEERNTAQIQSFIDEKDQWESLELYEQELLSSKEETLKRLSELN